MTLTLGMGLASAGCDDPPPPGPPPTATVASTPSGPPAPPPPPPPRELTPPAASAIAALDVPRACVAICEAQVRCTVDADVLRDAEELARRVKRCGPSCVRNRVPEEAQAQYLDQAKRCLNATDCDMFSGCAFGSSFTHDKKKPAATATPVAPTASAAPVTP